MSYRRRRRNPPTPDNNERWLVSYADFITLLFAFFVVMYAVSSVNEGKYKVLSATMEGVFVGRSGAKDPIDFGGTTETLQIEEKAAVAAAEPAPAQKSSDNPPMEGSGGKALRSMAADLAAAFGRMIEHEVMSLELNDDWLVLTLNDSLLFGPGMAEPHYDAFPTLDRIARIISGYDNDIRIEGYTDNLPVKGARFPSNWELSAARAASVVRFMVNEGVAPDRLSAVGFGESRPVARNDTEVGRRKNRRVAILVSATDPSATSSFR